MTQAASTTSDQHDFAVTPLRWWALALAALAIFATYYESDVIGELADLLGRQRGFTQAQIGNLNAAMYWPSVGLALFGGVLIDRFGAARMACWTAGVGVVGAVLTAIGEPYAVMWVGRFLFGVCEGAIFMALIAGLALWFPRSGIALATSLFLSLARVGSFMCNRSTIWAKPLYDAGWQPPLWLGAAITAGGFVAALLLLAIVWLFSRHIRVGSWADRLRRRLHKMRRKPAADETPASGPA
jgi:MFS family permease